MATKAHSTLTGSDLHEPKGISTANQGQVYISDGAGSGTWTDTGATIGASAFTTGDLKPTLKTTPDDGWIMCDDGTIGDLSSGASNLASSTTQSLFYLLWNNYANTEAAVSTGRGASAAADFAAHKTIALPKMLGRVYGVAGAGSGLTSRTLGVTVGEETHTLITSETPSHSHTITLTSAPYTTIPWYSDTNVTPGTVGNGIKVFSPTGNNGSTTYQATTPTASADSTGGGGSHNNVQPTVFLNMMVKL